MSDSCAGESGRQPARGHGLPDPVRQSHGISLIGRNFHYVDCVSFRRIGGTVAARGDRANLRFQTYRRWGNWLAADFPIARGEWPVRSASWRSDLRQYDVGRAHKQRSAQLNRLFDAVTITVYLVRLSRYIA